MIAGACGCWECRKARGIPSVAPLLTRLWREREALAPQRRELRYRVRRLEALVAHRELQLIRAGRSRNGKYVKQRERKLEDARRWLETAKTRLEALA